MENLILQNESPAERLEQLKNSAYGTEEFSYPRSLESGEVQELQSQLSQDMIAVDKAEQVLKVAKEVYKAATKPVKQTIGKNLQKIRTQVEEITGTVYLMQDLQDGKMRYYSPEGRMVFERNLFASEMQYSITDHLKKVV